MAVPKNKVSKSKTNSRFANWKLKTPGLTECPQCHELIKSQYVPNADTMTVSKLFKKRAKNNLSSLFGE